MFNIVSNRDGNKVEDCSFKHIQYNKNIQQTLCKKMMFCATHLERWFLY